MEELKVGEIEFELAGEFLAEIKKEFGRGDKELVKVAELKKIEQGGRTMEEFMQDFKRTAMSRSKKVDLIYFIFLFIFYFLFNLFFYFSIFRTTRIRVDWSCHHISHLMA